MRPNLIHTSVASASTKAICATAVGSALLLLGGCNSLHSTAALPLKWTPDNLSGLAILLVKSPGHIQFEWLRFSRNGRVSAEYGVSGPDSKETLTWQILPNGKLGISSNVDIYEELTLISRTPKAIVAKKRKGEVVEYKILHQEPKKHLIKRSSVRH